MPNVGKNFEQSFRKSCPDSLLVYRPPDAAQSFSMGDSLRFSQHSPCDYMIFDGANGKLFTLELKTFEGSCSFERSKEDKGIIHYYQVASLKHFAEYLNVYSGFILDFRKNDTTYYLSVTEWDNLINSITKKSFNEKDLLSFSNPILIEKKKLRTNYRYNVDKLLKDVIENDYK